MSQRVIDVWWTAGSCPRGFVALRVNEWDTVQRAEELLAAQTKTRSAQLFYRGVHLGDDQVLWDHLPDVGTARSGNEARFAVTTEAVTSGEESLLVETPLGPVVVPGVNASLTVDELRARIHVSRELENLSNSVRQ